MLSTVLEKLQALLPKRLFLAGFIPLLLVLLANGSLLYFQHPRFRDFADTFLIQVESGGLVLRNAALLFLLVLLLAFVYLALNTRLREVLEGTHWPAPFRGPFVRRQRRAHDDLQGRYQDLQTERGRIEPTREKWEGRLKAARLATATTPRGPYGYWNVSARQMRRLRRRRDAGRVIRLPELERALEPLEKELTMTQFRSGARVLKTDGAIRDKLELEQQDALKLFEYATLRLRSEIIELYNQRQFSYPRNLMAPTAMGNVARTIGSYTASRYNLNIDLLWSRLQKVMQGDEYFGSVQDAKTQLDALVSTFWLVAASTAAWLVYHSVAGVSWPHFAGVAVGGLLLLWITYLLGVQSYRAFADLIRGSVDLFRFDLLEALHIALPADTAQERALWETLGRQLRYGERPPMAYEHESAD